jgi:hypothetical protein
MPTVTELTEQLELAKVAQSQADREREARQKELDRQMRGLELNTGNEIRQLKAKVDQAIGAKASTSRPSPETRALARRFLHRGIGEDVSEYHLLELLAKGDPRWGELYSLLGTAQQTATRMGINRIADEALNAAVDAIECKAWAAVVTRAAYLAGESA